MNSPFTYAGSPPRRAVEVTRYGRRNWAVWLDGELLAVTLYKKGATAVAHALTSHSTRLAQAPTHDTHADRP